jgi:hypothetical protein
MLSQKVGENSTTATHCNHPQISFGLPIRVDALTPIPMPPKIRINFEYIGHTCNQSYSLKRIFDSAHIVRSTERDAVVHRSIRLQLRPI